jgi:hypothetical protein
LHGPPDYQFTGIPRLLVFGALPAPAFRSRPDNIYKLAGILFSSMDRLAGAFLVSAGARQSQHDGLPDYI